VFIYRKVLAYSWCWASDGRLAVPPAQIGQELIDCFEEHLLAFPEFAFGDKNILPLRPDQDVGLALKVERFSGGLSLEHPVQLDEEVRTQPAVWVQSAV
jgi:hypothetical protein